MKRKKAILKVIRRRATRASGYHIVKHSWIWSLRSYPVMYHDLSQLVKLLPKYGYPLTVEEIAIAARAVRKGNPGYFEDFETGRYIPTQRDIEKVYKK